MLTAIREIETEIILSPLALKQLTQWLDKQLALIEEKFGEIKTGEIKQDSMKQGGTKAPLTYILVNFSEYLFFIGIFISGIIRPPFNVLFMIS